MSAKGRVEFVLTADDAKAAQAVSKLLEKVRQSGDQFDHSGRKQKTMFDEGVAGATKFAMSFTGIGGALKLGMDMLDQYREKIKAVIEAQEKAAGVSRSYGETLRGLFVNEPGASKEDYTRIDAMLRDIANRRSLGEGGLEKLVTGYSNVINAAPLMSEKRRQDAAEEVGRMLEFSPSEDPAGIGIGIGKIMQGNGDTVQAMQALNALRVQQQLGQVNNIASVGASNAKLEGAASFGQASLAEMMGLWAYMTQRTGDRGGEETATAIAGMVSKIMTRGATITDKMGGMTEVSGGFFERLNQISDVYRSGQMSEDEVGKLLPDLTRSETAKMATLQLLGGEIPVMQQKYQKPIADAFATIDSITERNIFEFNEALPAEAAQSRRRAHESRREAKRAGDVGAAESTLFREEFEAEMKARRRGANDIALGTGVREMLREEGFAEDTSRRFATAVADLNPRVGIGIPGTKNVLGGELRANPLDVTSPGAAALGRIIYEAVRSGFRDSGGTPRRPLQETGAR